MRVTKKNLCAPDEFVEGHMSLLGLITENDGLFIHVCAEDKTRDELGFGDTLLQRDA